MNGGLTRTSWLRIDSVPNRLSRHGIAGQVSVPDFSDGAHGSALFRDLEAARFLNCGRSTIWRLWETGQLGYVRFGRNRRVELSELVRFIEEHRAE